MRHPLTLLQPDTQKKGFIILFSLTVLIMVAMNLIGAPLTTASAPSGIVSFELAFSPAQAQEIIDSWSPDAQIRAAFIQGLDFLFPLVYSLALGLGCILVGHGSPKLEKSLVRWGTSLAWWLVLAAACDYVENIALVNELFGNVVSPFPQIAGICALFKFFVIILALIFILFWFFAKLVLRRVENRAT
jgi:hypothetical protein